MLALDHLKLPRLILIEWTLTERRGDSFETFVEIFGEHERVSRLTSDINQWMRYLMGVYYFCSVAPIDLGIVMLLHEHNLLIRLGLSFLLLVVLLNAMFINHLQAQVINSAHGCHPLLNALMARKRMTVRLKLKVLAVIEKLTGPEIGLYCFDLFPFTNYAFALLIANVSSSLVMFIDLTESNISEEITKTFE